MAHVSSDTEASVGTLVVSDHSRSLMVVGWLKCYLSPSLDTSTQLLVTNIVELELRLASRAKAALRICGGNGFRSPRIPVSNG